MDIDYPNMNGYYHVLSFCFKDEEFWITSSDEDEVSVKECSTTEPIWQIVFFLMLWQSLYRVSNTALNVLLKALAVFVRVIGTSFSGNKVESLSSNMPRDTKAAHKLLFHTGEDDFINYVVCPKCHSIYEYKDCIVLQHGRRESIECHHVSYPNHPQLSRRSKCGATLLKRTRDDKLVPIKTYCYQPLHKSLHNLVQKEGFLDACEHWRARSPHSPHLVDIYDGQVWHDLESSGFLGAPFCYALTLNVDWFQPFTHIQYSIGAIYLTVQNLPRTERYKAENMILVGIIPGPAEPPLTINSYLAPLVDDLKHAWSPGISISTRNCSSITVRLALTCVACDIPASRKVCGFVGHNARLGCNNTSSIRSEDQSTLNVLNMSLCPLNSIPSFNNNHAASLLPPFREDVFTSQLLKDLTSLYGKLYAHLSVSHHFISPFFLRSGRINFCGQLIGSEMNATSSCSSVIMAYWPSKGDDLSTIDYGERMAVGTVQYFCKHRVTLVNSDNHEEDYEHVLAYVSWKQRHPHSDWYGISATVTINMYEFTSWSSFIPVQRIHCVCAHSVLEVDIHGVHESVFIAVPIPFKLTSE